VTESAWHDLVADLAAREAAEVRDDAVEVYLAEAARARLAERTGEAVVHLVTGRRVRGRLVASSVHGCLRVVADRDDLLVPQDAIVRIDGSRGGLRHEGQGLPWTIGSWLRAIHAGGGLVQVVLRDATTVAGSPTFVGGDHVEIEVFDTAGARAVIVVPFAAAVTWQAGG